MGTLGDTHPRPPGPPNTTPFPSDSVLSRMARGAFKPTDADLEELRTLAQSGNRAERRAAGKQLKKLGIAVPAATPASPVVLPASDVADKHAAVEPRAPVKATAQPATPANEAAKKAAPKKTAPKKAPPKKAAPKKAAPKKAAPKKAAPKKAAPRKTATKKKR
jgi:hypothetical protein